MDDFLKTAFERLRHFCDEGLVVRSINNITD
jgi:hypothetical protein